MGNTVCTDKQLLTAEDIQALKLKFKPDPEQVKQWEKDPAFSTYEHNIRAFGFNFSRGSAGASSSPRSGRSGVTSTPIDLSEDVILDPTNSYVVMHLQRLPAGKASPPKGYDYPTPEPPFEDFAKTCEHTFTPRGISAMFSVDISALKRRTLDTNQQPFIYLFKLYVYNGKKASSLVSAVAVMSAFTLEKVLLKNSEFCAAMFYNSFASSTPAPFKTPRAPEPSMVNSASSSPRTGQDSIAMFRDHAFLRSFYNMLSPSEQAMNNTTRSVLSTTTSSPNATLRRPLVPGLGLGNVGGASSSNSAMTSSRGGVPTMGGSKLPPSFSLNFNKVQTIIPEDHEDTRPSPFPGGKIPMPAIGGNKVPGFGLGLNLVGLKAKIEEARSNTSDEEVVPDEENPNAREERLLALKFVASEVYPRVFVGGEFARKELANLLENNISVVINAVGTYGSGSLPNLFPKEFEYLSLQLSDDPTETIDAFFPIVNQLIDTTTTEKREGVFIHCHQGVSRSASLALAYMMWKEGFTFETARLTAREKRNIISPNSGFIARLILWGKHLANPKDRVLYMYTRYNRDFPFPYCFRMVLPSATSNVIDTASCYVALERDGPSSPYKVTFFSGAECDDIIADDARELMETLLPYAFYTGKPTKDGDVIFNPVTFDFQNIKEIRGDGEAFIEIARRILQEAGSVADIVSGRHDPDADLDVIVEKYQEMMEERRMQSEGASRRKRNREAKLEEEKRLREIAEEEEEAPPQVVRGAPSPFAGGFGLKLGGVAPPPVVAATDFNEIHVYEYPFEGPARGRIDFIDKDDLNPENAYCLVFIATKGDGDAEEGDHDIVLYTGGDCDITSEELFQAFNTRFVDAHDDDEDASAEGLKGSGIVISTCKPTRASEIRVQMFTEVTLPAEYSRRLE